MAVVVDALVGGFVFEFSGGRGRVFIFSYFCLGYRTPEKKEDSLGKLGGGGNPQMFFFFLLFGVSGACGVLFLFFLRLRRGDFRYTTILSKSEK